MALAVVAAAAAAARLLLLLSGALLAPASPSPAGAGPIPGEDSSYDVVFPVKVDERGRFLSFNLSHRLLSKRDVSPRSRPFAFYRLQHEGQPLRFNLTLNSRLLAPGFLSERRYGGIAHASIRSYSHNSCHMIGSVRNQERQSGLAALSACDGLKGVFRLANEDFFIEPLETSKPRENTAHPHKIYRRHVPEYEAEEFISVVSQKAPALSRMCGVRESLEDTEKRREKWEEKQRRKRRIKQRSVSKEKWVETLVVADTKMVEYHGSDHVEKYVLTVMNMVAGLFHDASIGNPIHISIVRLIFLEEEEEDLKITHHADNTLRSFCKWQKAMNIKGDTHPLHHDVAILLTRKDLCTAMNHPCETLGLSHVSGMCQPHRSCNINEDTGLPLAFTVAHELGHSFGIQHDGSGNDCEPVGKRPFIMSPQLLYDTSPLTWSHCSREYITRFLDRGWGLCLDDPPTKDVIDFPSVPPGVLYDVSHQCRLQYGPYSTYCDDMDSVCNTLWCSVGNTCHSKLDAAVDGTKCDENKWCFGGSCVHVGYRPESTNGGWAAWGPWEGCSRTCGAGVQSAERQCNSPTPKYGGRYCLGERKRFRVCSTQSCPSDKPSFRHIQCGRFDAWPYKGKFYKWTPVPNNSSPCELHCRPENEYFAEKLRDAVFDGTPCYEGKSAHDMCINGICKNVGCDYEIDSYAVEDRCGVCRGDGSSCQTVKKTFEEREGLGYVDVGLIPAGAREIQIEEVAEAENFLALRSEDPEKYFLNGGWTIQWNGEYKVAGTTFTYERTGNWENLTSPGPTEEPVWIQLLFQEKNPGVRYQYTIQRESENKNEIAPTQFFWQYGPWTKCTATCGTGVQRQVVRCVEIIAGVVEERYCKGLIRPDDKQRSCSEEPCPARWWTGEWQACSATCGDTGLTKRTVLCIQSVGLDEQKALQPISCQNLPKPDATAPCNREVSCPAKWVMGNWSECSVTCGSGAQRRPVYCPRDARASCDLLQKPTSEIACSLPPCQNRVENAIPDWSGSGSSSRELYNEINFIPDHHMPKLSPSLPRSEDLNIITEEDFSSPNNNKKGNVFVDDFYYDYNFINFHEDLSYDPIGEEDSRRREEIPDVGEKTVNHRKEDSPESHPTFFQTVKPEERMKNRSLQPPATKQNNKEEPVKVEESSTHVNLPDSLGSVVDSSVIPGQREGTHVPLLEDYPSPSAAARHFPDSKSDHPSTKETHENLSTSRLSKENVVSPTSFPSLAILTPRMPSGKDNENESATSHLDTRIQDPRSSTFPGQGNSLWKTTEGSKEEPSYTARAPANAGDDSGTAHKMTDVQIGSVTTVDPRTSWWPFQDFYQLTHSAETTPAISVQNTKETSRGPDNNMNLHSSENNMTHYVAGAQDWQRNPSGALEPTDALPGTADHPGQVPLLTSANGLPGAQRQRLPSHSPNSMRLQPSAEPTTLEQVSTSSSSFLSMPAAPRWKESSEIKTDVDSMDLRGRNKGSPSEVNWDFAGPHGRLGPSVTTAKQVVSPVAPSPIVAAAFNASWEAGNWSECSTTCGLGAIWRAVSCSTGREDDCTAARKPVPARRCYLRPCSTWRMGNWSKCSRACGGGMKVRDVQCIDTRDQRPLRPFHCQAIPSKPPSQMPCQTNPCLGWYTSAWRECSELCGGGEQERLVTCPEFGRCDEALRPNNTRPCNIHPCTKWTVGPWGQCTATCGGGIQRRQVKCVNTKTGEAEEDRSRCGHERWPENIQKCNPQDCSLTESGFVCERDRLSFSFCQTLRLLGRCHLPTVSAQCCQTCHQHDAQGHRERGEQRASRK
ncbi:A disintegrin and metalloproteinase with thrombospondin motifs 7 isoform X2 [Sceloporus undulatus]|uniref:A disintegrin and metalloproteinase with thrombospondin motifs 7 isoform X2 n=1 Tax=Sceloporus undulatus TaxID=8520 RepID=UPI001C4C4D4B|nr:A disintegrin and metalloproteinase with thrombospondin motifs 7 isoform X2 [Sceloporus undulatus]